MRKLWSRSCVVAALAGAGLWISGAAAVGDPIRQCVPAGGREVCYFVNLQESRPAPGPHVPAVRDSVAVSTDSGKNDFTFANVECDGQPSQLQGLVGVDGFFFIALPPVPLPSGACP